MTQARTQPPFTRSEKIMWCVMENVFKNLFIKKITTDIRGVQIANNLTTPSK